MKYLKYWDVPDDKMDEAIQKWGAYLEKSQKTPEKYPRYIFPPHGMGKASGGVSIMEADNEEQLINYMVELTPPMTLEFVPLIDSNKFIETYIKHKK